MPSVYLSPSTQEFNQYVNGGTEEEYANLIVDYMLPYLRASGITYGRNTPDMTAASSIRQSNEGNWDLHLAIHSNAAAPSMAGQVRGSIAFYYPSSTSGQRAAEIIANNFKMIYPNPALVITRGTTTLGEVTRTKAPAVLFEIAYHDNPQDAAWIKNNLRDIARNLSLSLADYFDVPFVTPEPERTGTVTANALRIRARPGVDSPVLRTVPRGTQLTVLGQDSGWYTVQYDGTTGYAASEYISVS